MIRPTFLTASLVFAGCAQPAQSEAPQSAAVATVTVESKPAPVWPNYSDGPPVASPYPLDIGGRAVARAVAPDTPALVPAERLDAAPAPRTPPARLLNP